MSAPSPDFYNPIYYSVVKRPFFRFNFPGLEEIQVNHSQLHQDMFVLSILNGKKNGTYLEIGAHEPIFISNTALLEEVFGWRGLGFELDPELVAAHKRFRRNPCLQADALAVDFQACLKSFELPEVIDYLSLDIDPPVNSLAALRKLPHEDYRFRVITFEHDLSFGGAQERLASREFLKGLGYQLVVGDVSWGGHIVEDWWVDPALTNPGIVKRLAKCKGEEPTCHDQYFYNMRSSSASEGFDSYVGGSARQHGEGLCVEGWRGINHSYALVNQWQLLELLRHPMRLRHRDTPFFDPKWSVETNYSGLPDEAAERIRQIPHPMEEDFFSVLYRIGFPMNLSEGNAERLFVFGTTELGACTDGHFSEDGPSPDEVARRDNVYIVTPSHWSKRGFVNAGFQDDSIHVLPHGVATSIFRPVEPGVRSLYRQIFGFRDEDFVLLNIGSLTANKGIDLLLKAFANLKAQHSGLKLVIKDQGNLYSLSLASIAKQFAGSTGWDRLSEKDWQDVISISENLDMESLQALYNACDAYVSPYRGEGFNLPPLEAAACGLPIIVTAGGATDDYFNSNLGLQITSTIKQAGKFLYLEPELEALQAAIEQVMASPRYWGGAKGSEWVQTHFSWERIGERLWDLLDVS